MVDAWAAYTVKRNVFKSIVHEMQLYILRYNVNTLQID